MNMAGGVSMVAASAATPPRCGGLRRNNKNVHEKPRHAIRSKINVPLLTTRARVRASAPTTAASGGGVSRCGSGKGGASLAGGTRARHLSSRGGVVVGGGGGAAALRWWSFNAVDTGTNARDGCSRRRRRAARINTRTRAIMDPTTYAPSQGTLSYAEVFTTNIFAPG